MTPLLWTFLPYAALTLFFVVPFVRLSLRPFDFTTRATSMFSRDALGLFSAAFHWGLLLVLIGHVIGLIGGVLGLAGWVDAFFWIALVGGVLTVLGSLGALIRRVVVPEVRALSQVDDYLVHVFLIAILGVALYQAVIHRIWGVAYNASAWFASLLRFQPEPELMASAPLLSQIHVGLALALAAYFPFTKLVHAWTLPVNYFWRPYQPMRTAAAKFRDAWDFSLRSDKGFLTYLVGLTLVLGLGIGFLLPSPTLDAAADGAADAAGPEPTLGAAGASLQARSAQSGYPLYVSQCARCHGLEGDGNGPGAASPTFAQPPRSLVSGPYRYVSTQKGVASDADLRHVIVQGLPAAGMPAFPELSDAQVASLVDVIGAFWAERPEPGPPVTIEQAPELTPEMAEAGKATFQSTCSACHGQEGQGDGPSAPGLAVPPTDFTAGEVKAGTTPSQLYYRIAAGIPGENGPLMPAFDGLGEETIWNLVAHLRLDLLPERALDPPQQETRRAASEMDASAADAGQPGDDGLPADARDANADETETSDTSSTDWNEDLGASTYADNCTSCHQANGQGVPGAFPALAGHARDLIARDGGRDYLVNVLLYGLEGEISIGDQSYDGTMPAWSQLDDDQIAAVLNHALYTFDGADPTRYPPYTADDIPPHREQDLTPEDVRQERQELGPSADADADANGDRPAAAGGGEAGVEGAG